eukprot:CAMPEP_0201481844 /NCGR_PEP_ID=MMETSP0151_2-20130828/6109_1 /ASSEMBLY_ACC=CAM_ASM_000257 /TAXON_ID=200890 /ORGANISM="Paramoeba atlantica, Strain 621/1 / CCAP 1560/9" /LENGTH=96 /DNA_ID=CAMNT_0047864227 /DNA_START=129 /DNA_END=416 /DNA_ORIENTATION=+
MEDASYDYTRFKLNGLLFGTGQGKADSSEASDPHLELKDDPLELRISREDKLLSSKEREKKEAVVVVSKEKEKNERKKAKAAEKEKREREKREKRE